MAYGKPVWGIDVGQSALKALRLRWGANGPEVLAIDIIEHPKVLSQPDADEEQLIRDALEKFARRNLTKGDRVVISVPGQAAFARFIKLPPVERKKIPEIVRYEARQQIPFAIEDVLWDYQPVGAEAAGLETEIGLFAMKRDMINDFVSNFVMAKIEVEAVQIAPLALYNFLVVDEQIGQGATVLLDLGAENTNLLITDGNRIWLRNIPLGGNNFTRAVSKARKLTFGSAEAEKRTLRERRDAQEIFAAIQPVFAELLAEVQRSMGYFTSLHRDVRIERILGMGNAFRTPGLRRYLAQNLQYRVDQLHEFKRLADSPRLKTKEAQEHFLALPTAYGLALQGLEVAPIYTNLLPPEIRRARIISRKKPAAAVAVGALALVVGVSFLDALNRRSKALNPSLMEDADRALQKVRAQEQALTAAKGRVTAAMGKARPLVSTVKGRGVHLVILNEFCRILDGVNASARRQTGDPEAGIHFGSLVRAAEAETPEKYLAEGAPREGARGEGRAARTGGGPGEQPAAVPLKDPLIAGKPCWVYSFQGFTRSAEGRTVVPPVITEFFEAIEKSRLFSQVMLDGEVLPRPRRVPQLIGTVEEPRDVEMRQVVEWHMNIRFFCVVPWAEETAEELAKRPAEPAP